VLVPRQSGGSWIPTVWIPDRGSGRRTGQTHGSAPTNTMTFGDDPCPVMAAG